MIVRTLWRNFWSGVFDVFRISMATIVVVMGAALGAVVGLFIARLTGYVLTPNLVELMQLILAGVGALIGLIAVAILVLDRGGMA